MVTSTAIPARPPVKLAPTASEGPITIRLWITMLSTDWATLPRLSAPRQIGETSSLSIVPLLMSSMKPIPVHPALEIASMTTTPGVRNSMYEPPLKPGMSTDALEQRPEQEQPDDRLDERDADPGRLA
jgi:hypothetical protein